MGCLDSATRSTNYIMSMQIAGELEKNEFRHLHTHKPPEVLNKAACHQNKNYVCDTSLRFVHVLPLTQVICCFA